jgi:hypothetical protein
VEVSRRCALPLAVAQPPPAKARGRRTKERKNPAWIATPTTSTTSAIACPARSAIRASTATLPSRSTERKSWRGISLPSPNCATTPTVCCSTLAPIPNGGGGRRKYGGKVDFHDLSRFAALGRLEEKPHSDLYTTLVWPVSLKRQGCLVGLGARKEVTKPRHIVLASTDVTLEGRKLVELYVARLQIEFLFRDSKQFTGLTRCKSRAELVLDFHFDAALATLTLARAEELHAQPASQPRVFSMVSWKQRHFTERLVDVFINN